MLNAHQKDMDKQQAGDPWKSAAAMIKIVSELNPPLNLFLGEDAWQLANQKMEAVKNELETWKELTVSTAF